MLTVLQDAGLHDKDRPSNVSTVHYYAQPSKLQSPEPTDIQPRQMSTRVTLPHANAVVLSYHAELPPEILGLIFDFIRDHDDMAHVRLVCAAWRVVMARQMWATFITDFHPSDRQDLAALVEPRSEILPHVRRLIVCKVPGLFLGDSETALRRFLGCVPRNSLKEFASLSSLSPAIFKDLIVWQPRLERFEAFVDPVLAEFKQCGWMLPHLAEIKVYRMWIKRTTQEHTLEIH